MPGRSRCRPAGGGVQEDLRVPSAYGDEADRRVTLLWFVEDDPQDSWQECFAHHAEAISGGGLGVLEFAGPFVPTVPGTDRHIDDLR